MGCPPGGSRPARHRHDALVREAAQERRGRGENPVVEHAERLARQDVLRNAVEVVDRRLRRPADREAMMDVRARPIEDLPQLVPVADLLEGQVFHRRSGDDEPVEPLRADVAPRPIEGVEMIGRGVARDVLAHPHQGQLDLQGRGPEQARELRLGADLVRHEVEEPDPQGADVLADGVGLAHHHQALGFEGAGGGQVVGDLDGHVVSVRLRSDRRGVIRLLPARPHPPCGAPPCPERQVGVGRRPNS